jgi:hypothetical protein
MTRKADIGAEDLRSAPTQVLWETSEDLDYVSMNSDEEGSKNLIQDELDERGISTAEKELPAGVTAAHLADHAGSCIEGGMDVRGAWHSTLASFGLPAIGCPAPVQKILAARFPQFLRTRVVESSRRKTGASVGDRVRVNAADTIYHGDEGDQGQEVLLQSHQVMTASRKTAFNVGDMISDPNGKVYEVMELTDDGAHVQDEEDATAGFVSKDDFGQFTKQENWTMSYGDVPVGSFQASRKTTADTCSLDGNPSYLSIDGTPYCKEHGLQKAREVYENAYGMGNVWDTNDLTMDFEVVSFLAPYVTVVRKADGQKGTLEFASNPRFYFNFIADTTYASRKSAEGKADARVAGYPSYQGDPYWVDNVTGPCRKCGNQIERGSAFRYKDGSLYCEANGCGQEAEADFQSMAHDDWMLGGSRKTAARIKPAGGPDHGWSEVDDVDRAIIQRSKQPGQLWLVDGDIRDAGEVMVYENTGAGQPPVSKGSYEQFYGRLAPGASRRTAANAQIESILHEMEDQMYGMHRDTDPETVGEIMAAGHAKILDVIQNDPNIGDDVYSKIEDMANDQSLGDAEYQIQQIRSILAARKLAQAGEACPECGAPGEQEGDHMLCPFCGNDWMASNTTANRRAAEVDPATHTRAIHLIMEYHNNLHMPNPYGLGMMFDAWERAKQNPDITQGIEQEFTVTPLQTKLLKLVGASRQAVTWPGEEPIYEPPPPQGMDRVDEEDAIEAQDPREFEFEDETYRIEGRTADLSHRTATWYTMDPGVEGWSLYWTDTAIGFSSDAIAGLTVDLRMYLPETDQNSSNNELSSMLVSGVPLPPGASPDPESSMSYFYFPGEQEESVQAAKQWAQQASQFMQSKNFGGDTWASKRKAQATDKDGLPLDVGSVVYDPVYSEPENPGEILSWVDGADIGQEGEPYANIAFAAGEYLVSASDLQNHWAKLGTRRVARDDQWWAKREEWERAALDAARQYNPDQLSDVPDDELGVTDDGSVWWGNFEYARVIHPWSQVASRRTALYESEIAILQPIADAATDWANRIEWAEAAGEDVQSVMAGMPDWNQKASEVSSVREGFLGEGEYNTVEVYLSTAALALSNGTEWPGGADSLKTAAKWLRSSIKDLGSLPAQPGVSWPTAKRRTAEPFQQTDPYGRGDTVTYNGGSYMVLEDMGDTVMLDPVAGGETIQVQKTELAPQGPEWENLLDQGWGGYERTAVRVALAPGEVRHGLRVIDATGGRVTVYGSPFQGQDGKHYTQIETDDGNRATARVDLLWHLSDPEAPTTARRAAAGEVVSVPMEWPDSGGGEYAVGDVVSTGWGDGTVQAVEGDMVTVQVSTGQTVQFHVSELEPAREMSMTTETGSRRTAATPQPGEPYARGGSDEMMDARRTAQDADYCTNPDCGEPLPAGGVYGDAGLCETCWKDQEYAGGSFGSSWDWPEPGEIEQMVAFTHERAIVADSAPSGVVPNPIDGVRHATRYCSKCAIPTEGPKCGRHADDLEVSARTASDQHCPKCGSRLYPVDEQYMEKAGVCSYCVTNDTTPDQGDDLEVEAVGSMWDEPGGGDYRQIDLQDAVSYQQ